MYECDLEMFGTIIYTCVHASLECLEAHATPRHESGDRDPFDPPPLPASQYPLTPPTALGSPAVPCSECTHAQETKKEKKKKRNRKCQEKWRTQRTAGKVR